MTRAFAIICFLASFPLGQKDAREIVRALEARYRQAATLKAVFFERYTDGNGGIAAESGVVYFSRPGRMRWEYTSPEEKLFLVDGTNVWFFVPADRTVSRAKLKESSDWRTPIALLAGKADLGRLCGRIDLVNGSNASERPTGVGDTVLRCQPRAGGADDPIREVLLETDAEAHLVRVLIRESGKVETEFRFGNWEENIAIPEVKFHFAVPPGVAVVDEASLADALH
jgi:outer membrane lipoprotein carrier protein